MSNKSTPSLLEAIEKNTIGHYEANAQSFWQGTKDHDVSLNIESFLQPFGATKALDILDLGCGPGRDLLRFKQLGHRPIGLDGSKTFCAMAQQYSGCSVLHQSFLSLDLQEASFDGIFANASLFHVPRQQLPNVLAACHCALRSDGVLFISNPRGDAEGWQGQRYGNYMQLEQSQQCLQEAGFNLLHHYYRPVGLPLKQQAWLAIVSQRV